MNININNIIIFVMIPVWLIAEVFIIRWMSCAKPEKNITNKYPKKVVFLSQLPLGSYWKKSIDAEDIERFIIYQKRISIWYLSLIGTFFLFSIYLVMAF